MLELNRDPAFWARIASDPLVAPHMGGEVPWGALTASPMVHPLATEHGGYMFAQMDALGRLYDLHAAFKPSGWGKVANHTLKAALGQIQGWQIITATEVAGNWRSRPPKSFGFRPAGPSEGGFRTWVLTRAAWEQSPARRRTE